MCELALLNDILDECEEHGFSLDFEYHPGKGYEIIVGMHGLEGHRSDRFAAILEGLHLLKLVKDELDA